LELLIIVQQLTFHTFISQKKSKAIDKLQ